MANSMTGYGRAELDNGEYRIAVEMKSVNHRYLEVNVKTSRGYGFLEDKVIKTVSENVARGKIEVYVSVTATGVGGTAVLLNKGFAESYINALKGLQKSFKLKNDISVMTVARNTDIFTVICESPDQDKLTADVISVTLNAVEKFKEMREIEGKRLCDDVNSRIDTIFDKVTFIENRSPETVKAYRERLEARIKELLGDTEVDEQRLITETALFADKIAVAEETVRLKSHLLQLRDMLSKDTAVGRKIDFIVQEMNREANTTGSKAQDLDIINTVVDIKAEIEKIREQIQNIE